MLTFKFIITQKMFIEIMIINKQIETLNDAALTREILRTCLELFEIWIYMNSSYGNLRVSQYCEIMNSYNVKSYRSTSGKWMILTFPGNKRWSGWTENSHLNKSSCSGWSHIFLRPGRCSKLVYEFSADYGNVVNTFYREINVD